ncbi:hypothetical protein [Asanoa iriomotensis]|uniref:hypothetical protein n=1 Tax=Asanoa iriomotensis TaxID=234613 RepID=UPI0019450266|nr:hypothetical protein [Asanoa iriomotensis]
MALTRTPPAHFGSSPRDPLAGGLGRARLGAAAAGGVSNRPATAHVTGERMWWR